MPLPTRLSTSLNPATLPTLTISSNFTAKKRIKSLLSLNPTALFTNSMLKSMKKLKFWSRKKKKRERKTHHLPLPYYSPPPPPPPSRPPPPPPPPPPPQTHHSCCSCYRATEPSAPPLPPPWFTSDHYPAAGDTPLAPEFDEYPALPGESSWSYQQYTVPNPAYGIPVGPERAAETERSGRPPCWLLDLGIRLLGCFFPCYRIKDL